MGTYHVGSVERKVRVGQSARKRQLPWLTVKGRRLLERAEGSTTNQ